MQAREAAESLSGERKEELLGLLDTLVQGGCACATCGSNSERMRQSTRRKESLQESAMRRSGASDKSM